MAEPIIVIKESGGRRNETEGKLKIVVQREGKRDLVRIFEELDFDATRALQDGGQSLRHVKEKTTGDDCFRLVARGITPK